MCQLTQLIAPDPLHRLNQLVLVVERYMALQAHQYGPVTLFDMIADNFADTVECDALAQRIAMVHDQPLLAAPPDVDFDAAAAALEDVSVARRGGPPDELPREEVGVVRGSAGVVISTKQFRSVRSNPRG